MLRRSILKGIAFLASPFRVVSGAWAGPQKEFPFKAKFKPLQPEEALFPSPAYFPSFLHPNGRWVAFPNPDGGIDLWDWKKGIPIRHLPGDLEAGHPANESSLGGCGSGATYQGMFSAEGKAIIYLRKTPGFAGVAVEV